jgi:N-acetylmuramic acid 6-phosphate (MurNAc-6-P) etherase
MYIEKIILRLLCLDMHGSFQLKKSLVYKLIVNLLKNMWQITIGTFYLKSGGKNMLGVTLKNTNVSFTHE